LNDFAQNEVLESAKA